jgi:DNA-binding NtrC family response regulator
MTQRCRPTTTEGCGVTAPRSVLVIDDSSEADAVLRAVFEPRGDHVRRTRSHLLSESLTNTPPPDVVVIDLDNSSPATADFAWGTTAQVVLGSQRVLLDDAQTRFLEKPFQFPELVRAVEDLLAAKPAA